MATPKILTLTPDFLYWKEQHRQREQRRIEALKRGEVAEYGYWKDKPAQIVLNEPLNDDVPAHEYLRLYRLEVTRKQANDLIAEGAETINMVIRLIYGYKLTYKNALKLPNNHFIRDINGRLCLFRNKYFYKIF
jgi:vancomycin resistance protein YoaR